MAEIPERRNREKQMEHIKCDEEISKLRSNCSELGRCLAVIRGERCSEEFYGIGDGPCGKCVKCLQARIRELEQESHADEITIAELQAQLAAVTRERDAAWTNRDHFCRWVNEIARLFWGDDKQCYSPEATFRMVAQLQARNQKLRDAVSRYGKHDNSCHGWASQKILCSCGLDAALAALPAGDEQPE